jgi:Lamin Tail Domain
MKKIYTLFALFISILAHSQSTTVVISQVYSGGGVTSGTPTYKNDYVELHNVSATSQLLTGYSLQYGSNTGNFGSSATNIYSFTAGTSIPSGGYLLIQLGTVGTVGTNFPVSADFVTTNINMAAASGKIALANQATTVGCGATATACTLPNALLIDVVSYGASNNAEGGSGVNNGVALTNVQGGVRKTNGCQDTDNNNNDFTVTTNPVPRNSTSPVITCGGPVATISASPNITNITTSVGIASVSQSFNLSASNLTPAPGNLSIAPSTGLEISFDNTNFFSTAQNFAYTGSAVASTPIYVRISTTAAQGALTGATVTCSGGGAASNAVITVAGSVSQNFYSQPTGNLSTLATWGIATNGTGTAPIDFTSPYQIFNVVNRAVAAPGTHWEVSGAGSKLVIGDGAAPTTVSTSIADTILSTTIIDIRNLGILEIGSRVTPTFGNLAIGSTVNYNFNGTSTTDTVKINTASYHHLILKNGLKYLKSGTTTVNGNLVYDGTVNSNGAASPFSTISLKGNLTMLNAAVTEDSTTGSTNRFTLSMAGTGAQLISTQGSELNIFRLIRDTTVLSNEDITVAANSKITLGNNTSGGLSLLQKVSGTPTITRLILNSNAQLAIVKNGIVFTDATKAGKISSVNGKIIMNKSITSTSNPGTLVFEPGSTLNDLTVNITTPARDSVFINGTVGIAGNVTLTKGVIVLTPATTIIVDATATITGGGAASYIDGKIRKVNPTASIFLFPTGQAKQYAPVEMSGLTALSDFTVQYFKQAYSNLSVNPATSTAIPGYSVSTKEYWNIDRTGTDNPNIKFYYNSGSLVDGSQAKIAHFNGVDWDDIGRDSYGADVNGNFIAQNTISTFSPFTFGGAAGVLPILLQSFNGTLQNNKSTLQWKTSCEFAGDKFELQYSTDGINFVGIYTEDAIGTCVGNLYSYMHTDAKALVNYYRLVLKAIDGSAKFSNIIALKSLKKAFDIKLVSTNTNEQLCYSISAVSTGNAIIRIANMQGQLLLKENVIYNAGTQINYINTNKLSKGIYLISIVTNSGEVFTEKFIR